MKRRPRRYIVAADSPATGGALLRANVTAQRRIFHLSGWVDLPPEDEFPAPGLELGAFLDAAADGDRLELWYGPTFDAHVSLGAVAEALAERPALAAKTFLVAFDRYLGELPPEEARAFTPECAPLPEAALRDLWRAFWSDTPERLAALVPPDRLPHLAPSIRSWLRELPDAATGLGATQRRIVEASGPAGAEPAEVRDVFGAVAPYGVSPFGYWRRGSIVSKLCAAPAPALVGPRDSFTLAMHDDDLRFRAFWGAGLARTAFGEAVLAGREDYLARNPIDEWWGGTHLTSARCWRWDDEAGELVAPA